MAEVRPSYALIEYRDGKERKLERPGAPKMKRVITAVEGSGMQLSGIV